MVNHLQKVTWYGFTTQPYPGASPASSTALGPDRSLFSRSCLMQTTAFKTLGFDDIGWLSISIGSNHVPQAHDLTFPFLDKASAMMTPDVANTLWVADWSWYQMRIFINQPRLHHFTLPDLGVFLIVILPMSPIKIWDIFSERREWCSEVRTLHWNITHRQDVVTGNYIT